jgi:hypothetical protein
MALQIKKARRAKIKLKMAIEGPSGSGKTYSALLIARGLVPGGRVLVVDTENGSASLYSHLYEYFTVDVAPPFSPEKYVEAIRLAVSEKFDVLIIDSASHEWSGKGGLLDAHDNMPGNTWTNWAKVNPRHDAFVAAILQSPIHVISCLRTKEKHVQEEVNGKQVIKKLGAEAIQRDGLNYEFSTVLTMDVSHQAMSTKDRTGLFTQNWFTPDEETGRRIARYLDEGAEAADGISQPAAPAQAGDGFRAHEPANAVKPAEVAQIWEAYHEILGNEQHAKNAIYKVTNGRGSKEITPGDVIALLADIGRRREETNATSLRETPGFGEAEGAHEPANAAAVAEAAQGF